MTYLCSTKVGSVTKGGEQITYGYDGSLVTGETLSGTMNQSLAYGYNNDFRSIRFTYAGSSVDYSYDNDGLLTRAGNFTISRNSQNGLPESVTGGSLNISRDFNGYGEQAGESFSIKGLTLDSWNVNHDDSGRIVSKTETFDLIPSEYTYSYDSLGRLLTVTRDGTLIEDYQYSANGARSSETNVLRGISRTMSYSDEDHLLAAGDATYEYDKDGFLTTKTHNSQVTRYTYSSRGELLSVVLPDTRTIQYVTDPLGRRIAKRVGLEITEKYLWQGMTRLLAVYDGSDSLLMRFEYADARMPVAMTAAGSTYYLAYDQVGSLRLIVDQNGTIVKRVGYDSFGNVVSDFNPSFKIPFAFAGGLHDSDTGLVRFGFRDYDPDVGRWTAKDPILFKNGGTDLYGYVLNDPVNAVDPRGLWDEDVHSGIGNSQYGTYLWARQTGFTDSAAKAIAIANDATDGGFAGWMPMLGLQSRHFNQGDYEGYTDSRGYWADVEFDRAVESYKGGNCAEALGHIGKGLNSLQDIFAHRAWDTGSFGWNAHPPRYDDWNDPTNNRAADSTQMATKIYLKEFLKAIHQ
jgi:RHS repeat-associated protein